MDHYRYDPPTSVPADACAPGVVALKSWALNNFPLLADWGCLAHRRVAGQRGWSAHHNGRAVDLGLMMPFSVARGQAAELVDVVSRQRISLGVQGIIYNHDVWGFGRDQWRPYTGDNPHTDHVHVEVNNVGQWLNMTQVYEILNNDKGFVMTPEQWKKQQQDQYYTHVKLDAITALLRELLAELRAQT